MSQSVHVVELLQRMVRIASVSGDEGALGDAMFDLARRWKLEAQRLPMPGYPDQILIGVEATRENAPLVLFDSHLDTVSAEGMTIDPFGGEIRDGAVYGRGSCDTKGTGAAMLAAMHQYAQQADRPNRVALICAVEEETDMRGIRHFVEHDLPTLGRRPRAAIVGEPTQFHPVIAHNGLLRWRITTHGVAAHSSTPHDGRSAISAMVRIVTALERDYISKVTARDPLTGYAACSVNTIHGGTAANIIPDRCVIEVDRRLTPAEDADAENAVIDKLLASVDESVERFDIVRHPPLTTRHNEALVEQVVAVLGAMGLPKMTLGAAFSTHAAYYDAAGIPAVVLGPGDPHWAHTKDEHVEIPQLERGVELYLRLMNG